LGAFHYSEIEFFTDPPLPNGVKAGFRSVPWPLLRWGVNIPVIIGMGSVYRTAGNVDAAQLQATTLYAHLDTGASVTVVDVNLAVRLGLKSTGVSRISTAGGLRDFPNFIVDLHFANSTLKPFINLPIASAELNFDINGDLAGNTRNVGILIGRDAMASWNIMWNGPTSTVVIND
jgi:hypothetical protein